MCRPYLEVCVVDAFEDERRGSGLCGRSGTAGGVGARRGLKEKSIKTNIVRSRKKRAGCLIN